MTMLQGKYEDAGGRPLTGAHVLAILLGSFLIVAAVNATMIYYALSTFSGEVDPHPYEHGLAYNKDIAAAAAQEARHWQVAAEVKNHGMQKQIEATFRDHDGQPVAGLAVTAKLQFATDMARDRNVALTEVASGLYRGDTIATSGQWDLVIEAKRGMKPMFRSRSRVTLP